MNELKREIRVLPAWDKTTSDPKTNCGVHCAELWFRLKGPRGAIGFVIHTSWNLPHVTKKLESRPLDPRFPHLFCKPRPASVDYHSYVPTYEGQTPVAKCDLLDGKPCYCDGSGLEAQRIFDILVAKGDEAMWKELEQWYEDRLSKLEPIAEGI